MTFSKASCKLSLLVPCYNAENYIEDFLRHLDDLSVSFDEVIFYNDGSTDNTLQILKNSGHRYITSAANRGPGYARNQLAAIAVGDYIHFHDVDDRFNTNFIKTIHKYLPQKPDVVVGSADWIDQATGDLLIRWRYSADDAAADTTAYFISHPLGIINTVYKKASFLAAEGFNEQIKCWEDSDLHVKLAAQNNKFIIIADVLAFSIRHSNGISNDQNWCWQCRLKFLEGYLTALSPAYTNIVLTEISRCAQAFYNAGLFSDFNKCVFLCKQFAFKLPSSKNRLVNLLKRLPLPARATFDLIRLYNLFFIK
jgi:glycosyltransferase involved in cell wall biosynthesis